jgi:VIT1/CCC1 family predicted Fe2+/Mn2+ transporter
VKLSIQKGFSFGLTSGIITTLGLMVGLNSSTHSTSVVIGGILVIAVADALSDSLGMHVSEEAESSNTIREIWEATISTFLSKFVFALTFVVPVLLFDLDTAIIASIAWGGFLIVLISYYVAKQQKTNPFQVIVEHLIITGFVIAITHFVGNWASTLG